MNEFVEDFSNQGQSFNIVKYLRAFKEKWWLIILLTAVIAVPWYIYIESQPPVYQAKALIEFQNVQDNISLRSRMVRLKSRPIMEEVVAELGLTLEIPDKTNQEGIQINREDIFNYFSTVQDVKPGRYCIKFYQNGYFSIYHGRNRLDSLSEKSLDDTLSYNGMSFLLNPEIKRHKRADFLINYFNSTVNSLQSRLQFRPVGVGNMLVMLLKGRDPIIISRSLNMIADIFSEKSRKINKNQDDFVLGYLQQQCDIAHNKLSQYDYQLKSFRNRHPEGLDEETQQVLVELDRLETQIEHIELDIDMLETFLNRLDATHEDYDPSISAHTVYRQIANQRSLANSTELGLIKTQLDRLDREKAQLLASGRPSGNPDVVEINNDISILERKILSIAQKKIEELKKEKEEIKIEESELENKLENIPDEQLKAMKLQRERSASEDIYKMLLKRTREAQIKLAVESESVALLDPAVPPSRPSRKADMKKVAMGLMLGLALGFGSVLLLEELNKSIKTKEDVKNYLNMDLLGVIPQVRFDDKFLEDSEKAKSISSQIVTHDYSPTPVGEAYRSLRTNILFSREHGLLKSLIIASASPGEGKSFTATNLSIALAQQRSNTLLIDADLRRGVLHNIFKVPKKPGLTNYLTGVSSVKEILNETYIPNLSLITCGSMIPNPSELLGSSKMKNFIKGLREHFDHIIFDTCPLNAATDAVVLGSFVEGVAVIVRANETNRDSLSNKISLFQKVQANVIGIILNCAGVELAHEGYSYYRY
ncbi:MAG: polysaccharide biosynthesis tyrosine autokinase [bacterium]